MSGLKLYEGNQLETLKKYSIALKLHVDVGLKRDVK